MNPLETNSSAPDVFFSKASLVAQGVKNLPAMQETWVWFLGREDPLEKEMATHSSIFAWRIPMDRGAWRATVHGVTRVGRDLATKSPPNIFSSAPSAIPQVRNHWSLSPDCDLRRVSWGIGMATFQNLWSSMENHTQKGMCPPPQAWSPKPSQDEYLIPPWMRSNASGEQRNYLNRK